MQAKRAGQKRCGVARDGGGPVTKFHLQFVPASVLSLRVLDDVVRPPFMRRAGLDLTQFTPDDLMKLTWLRAVEWSRWPSFLAQPLLPISYILVSPLVSYAVVIASCLLWIPVRYRVANITLATRAVYWAKLTWVTAPICAIYLLVGKHWFLAILCLPTTFIAGVLGGFAFTQIGVMQKIFLAQLGFEEYLQWWESLPMNSISHEDVTADNN